MRNIKPYQGDALLLYDEIVEAKRSETARHATLTRLRPLIAQRYKSYETSQANLERLSPERKLTRDDRRALIHCYDVETQPLLRMKRDVLDALPREVSNKCPYCGLDSTGAVDGDSAGIWDHYLPRRSRHSINDGFAEFSALPANLIPCCAACNGRKSDRWKNVTQRTFINVYSDTIDQRTPLLEARIVIRADESEAEFTYVDMPYTPFSSLFKRHCDALKLRHRYAQESRSELARLRLNIRQRAHKRSADWFLEDFLDTARAEAEAFGINHWKPTLYRAAARSRDFVLHCLQGTSTPGQASNNGGQGA